MTDEFLKNELEKWAFPQYLDIFAGKWISH